MSDKQVFEDDMNAEGRVMELEESSPAHRDALLYERYLAECKATNTRATLTDFLVWVEDNDEELSNVDNPA